jgi:biopolymer transport protein ExbD
MIELDQELLEVKGGLQIAPLIDVVFLLLVYFMVTSSLRKSEGDLGLTLPGTVVQSKAMQMPDEQILEIQENGAVLLNNRTFGADGNKELPDLMARLTRYRSACLAAKTKALVTIQAADDVPHERVMDVLNACAGASIKHITFGVDE